ncbi:RluA family pseudouridine synthase [Granulosicoccus antarcticus]|uniref:Ribosomal large subunit pseudouridine synthase A n=1 Tax=Granulosicoccus antarcticus IMCC3135 TaxID=1192854 RepID=A0A2Z2NQW5_9GAMM|nr:RluA family pseudouridine synthase [Granulosicoccus antarcticus]ASJ73619.1 Ribosomal large subunit pseudouridine synthase A [Granulosicoccus antarcticus IMCC3135]
MNDIVDTFVAPACLDDIELLYQDDSLLLISKPSKLLSLSGKNPLNKDSVHFRLVQDFPTATLAHRLDLGTSGIMVVALDKPTNAHLTRQFQQRSIAKGYRAVLQGHLKADQGVIDDPIAKDSSIFPRLKICQISGKPALTHYQVEERWESPARSVVHFRPETGRTHQLRIHSQSIGHPILGCDLYGDEHSLRLADRLMLHAQTLDFVHPATGEQVHAVCPSPF